MIDAQKTDHKSLNKILEMIGDGKFKIPDFQRDFEWKPWDISNLMQSIFSDYYIGNLLLWKGSTDNFKKLSCEPINGRPDTGNPEYIVLDGQQRLTAMHYAFLAPDVPLPSRKKPALYFLDVDKLIGNDADDSVSYEWVGPKTQSLLENEKEQFKLHKFPLKIMGLNNGHSLYQWTDGYEKFWKRKHKKLTKSKANDLSEKKLKILNSKISHAERAVQCATDFKDLAVRVLNNYQIAYIELADDIPVPKVCDIFTQINSRGVRLDIFDLLNAMLVPENIQLKLLWREAEDRLKFATSDKMNVYVLQVMSMIKQNYCSPKYLYFLLPDNKKIIRDADGQRSSTILVRDAAEFLALWKTSVDCIEASLKLIGNAQEYGVTSSKYLPYVSILPVFSAIQSHIKGLAPNLQMTAQGKAKRWYWAAVFLNRYSGSVESTAARDYSDFKKWIVDEANEPYIVGEFRDRFRDLDLAKEVKRGASVYNGVFNLLVLEGARDWYTGAIPERDALDDHHIVPASWGKEQKLGTGINSILNRTPLSAETNRKYIRDRLPNEYLPELIAENGKEKVLEILKSHFISEVALEVLLRKDFSVNDFEEFQQLRMASIFDAMEKHLFGQVIDVPMNIQKLSGDIKDVEIGLRSLIAQRLEDDPSLLPDPVQEKIARFMARQGDLEPTEVDTESLSLEDRLQFCDLRELEETILNKGLWERFSQAFKKKEKLGARFQQLAEIRNCLSHHREISEVVRKEGEASTIWFKAILK